MAKKKNITSSGGIKKKRNSSLIAAVLLLSYLIGFFILSLVSAARSTNTTATVKPSASTINVSDIHDKRQESQSSDCIAKRDTITRKQAARGHSSSLQQDHRSSSTALHVQILKPKSPDSDLNLDSGLEHIPRCTDDGKFEPIQCLSDYCWCVNKYGQAVKNSARTNESPICDTKLYESEGDDHLVITGVGATRMKNFLKPSSNSRNSNDGDNSDEHNSHDHHQDGRIHPRDSDRGEFNRRLESSAESDLALVPNECTLSRENARARKIRHHDLDSIWIPDCDSTNGRLYAERQCHKSKVCWCVDQGTGLPLRSNEQLTKGPGINCTEVRRIIEIASLKTTKQESHNKLKPSFFHGFSESCDAERRSEFVQNLIGQFRQQLSDFLKLNPSISSSHSNPYSMSEEQVALWEFDYLDIDHDGKINEREWSKFKMNFKLVERLDINPPKLTESMSPLFILRSQRKCWRDFLEFCGDGDVLDYSLINQSKWLSCTELPAASAILSTSNDRSRYGFTLNQNPGGVPDAYTKAAAEARRKSKNPFLGILKPD